MKANKNTEVKINTLVGKGSELKGDFTVQGSARIDGKVDGNVTVNGSLIMGPDGCITGNVSAAAVLIGGEILGNIMAPEKAELTATAKVFGDITTKIIVIDEHAVFQGRCDMNQAIADRKNKNSIDKVLRAEKRTAKAAVEEVMKAVAEEEKKRAALEISSDKENQNGQEGSGEA